MPRSSRAQRVDGDRGAAIVELALVLPIFLILIFGLVQYGWTFYQVQETAHAVREGARVAAVGTQNTAGVIALVQSRVASASPAPDVTVCYRETTAPPGLSIGDEIFVRAVHDATDFNLPFVPFPNPLQISQDATTRTENRSANSNYPACD